MTSAISQENQDQILDRFQEPSIGLALFTSRLKSGLWMVGIPSWIFGITDRSLAAFSGGYPTAIELFHLITASIFFLGWLCLKPEDLLNSGGISTLQKYQSDPTLDRHEHSLKNAHQRMRELQGYHMISQEYTLPMPHVCQIYHLLNLKHLETVHNFSLNNLRILKVSDCKPTSVGGQIKFETVLDSPVNALRIWRQPIVEVDLTLLTPYTVELSIPVYNNKRIVVIFNALPISENEHKFLIDIYSNLPWPKPLLQIILHIASCLTLFEDLPYLQALADRKIHRLLQRGQAANHQTMWLFNRFVDLYGSKVESVSQHPAIEAQAV